MPGVLRDGEAAQNGVPELMAAQLAGRRHDPAHTERGADLLDVARAPRAGADDLLQGHDVGVDRAQNGGNPIRARSPIHAAAAMDVVRDHAEGRQGVGTHCAMIVPCEPCPVRRAADLWRPTNE